MKKDRKEFNDKIKVIWPLLALLIVGAILFLERTGIILNKSLIKTQDTLAENIELSEPVEEETVCLLIYQSENPASCEMAKQMELVLSDMKEPYCIADVSNLKAFELSDYKKIVYALTDLDAAGETIMDIANWVEQGGTFMNTSTFELNYAFKLIAGKMGIQEGGESYSSVSGFRILDDFMIGAENRDFLFDESYLSSIEVLLKPEAKIYVEASNSKLPLLWEMDYGKGKFIITNQALNGKVNRGLMASAYSLSEDIYVYPVINASAFYLDDFPAPVPSGDGRYILEEYGMDISNFYSNVWWEDMLKLEKIYGIKHIGLIIEDYSDIVEKPFKRTESVERFSFFGNMLLNADGELGFHGYNHMPLCLEGFDYKGMYDSYNLWKSEEDMVAALHELEQFSEELFPNETFAVYVPPSNILSKEGREILVKTYPELRAIASTYLDGDCVYVQEFEVAEDGIVETPRITSGAIFDDYSYMMAFSELNFHFVQSHFIHPDDVLDEDRGAALGWGAMRNNLKEYISWIYESAPMIQNVTGSGMADAVEIFDRLSLKRTLTENGIDIELGGFGKEASLMVRISEGELKEVIGATSEHIAGDLYLIKAQQAKIQIITE